MATLSKNGYEVARLTRQVDTPDDTLTVWERVEYSVRSNRRILKKRTVRFRASGGMSADTHSYGWKRHGRLKIDANLDRWLQANADHGFDVKRVGTMPEFPRRQVSPVDAAQLSLFPKVGAA